MAKQAFKTTNGWGDIAIRFCSNMAQTHMMLFQTDARADSAMEIAVKYYRYEEMMPWEVAYNHETGKLEEIEL